MSFIATINIVTMQLHAATVVSMSRYDAQLTNIWWNCWYVSQYRKTVPDPDIVRLKSLKLRLPGFSVFSHHVSGGRNYSSCRQYFWWYSGHQSSSSHFLLLMSLLFGSVFIIISMIHNLTLWGHIMIFIWRIYMWHIFLSPYMSQMLYAGKSGRPSVLNFSDFYQL